MHGSSYRTWFHGCCMWIPTAGSLPVKLCTMNGSQNETCYLRAILTGKMHSW